MRGFQLNFFGGRFVPGDPRFREDRRFFRHEHARRPKSREYRAWENVVRKDCAAEWVESFERFLSDVGLRPSGLGRWCLWRDDPEKPWGPGNAGWKLNPKKKKHTTEGE